MTIQEKIQSYRKKAGLSQEQLAEELRVSRQAISKWEQGTAQPTLDNCMELCRVFNIELNELLGNKTESKKEKKKTYFNGIVIVLLLISIGFNIFQMIDKIRINERMEMFEESINDLNHRIQNNRTEIVYNHSNTEQNELSNFEITGQNITEENLTLEIQLRLKKQTKNTKVGCTIKNGTTEYESETKLNDDYSFTVFAEIPMVNQVNIDCYKIENEEITHLIKEDYVVKERFIKDFTVTIDEGNKELNTKRLVLDISPLNHYQVYNFDKYGNPLKTLDFSAQIKEKDTVIAKWEGDHHLFDDKFYSDEVAEATAIFEGLHVFAYFENIDTGKIKNLDDVVIQVDITLNDVEIISKEILLKDLA